MLPIKNHFKHSLRSGHPQIGLWLGLASAYSAEILAGAGFDWLLIDGEHAPNDLPMILTQLQAIAAYPTQSIVRPVSSDPVLIKQLLDIGAQTLLLPMIQNARAAREAVQATRYPPNGIRGVGSGLARASRWNRIDDYISHADRQVCVLLQVESRQGIENLEAIMNVDGVDGIFIGPSDLAADLGFPGQPEHPQVQRVIEDAMVKIIANDKAAGILTASPQLAQHYLNLGALFVAVGVDTTLLARSAEALSRQFKTQNWRGKSENKPGVY